MCICGPCISRQTVAKEDNMIRTHVSFCSDLKECGLFYCHPQLMCSSGVHTVVINILQQYVNMVRYHSDQLPPTFWREGAVSVALVHRSPWQDQQRCAVSSSVPLLASTMILSKLSLVIWMSLLNS